MRYGTLPGIDKPVSRIAQGCMMLSPDDLNASFAILDAAFERGITAFDNGHVYGGGACDRVFGQWVRDRGIADRVVMLAKGAHHNQDRKRVTPFDVEADIADTLARSGLDHLDCWMFHRDDPQPGHGTTRAHRICGWRDGRIGAWGGSTGARPGSAKLC